MKTPALAVVRILATLLFGVAFGQTGSGKRTTDIPPDLLAVVQNEPDIKGCLADQNLPLEKVAHYSWLDLGRPHEPPALLVEGLPPCLAGNVNRTTFLYVRTGKGWRKVFDSTGVLKLGTTRTRGWPDLTLWRHGSADSGDEYTYQFDGNVYKATACFSVWYPEDGGPDAKPTRTPCDWDWKAQESW